MAKNVEELQDRIDFLQGRVSFLEYEIHLMIKDSSFWEHLTDHLIIAVSFTFLGFFLCLVFLKYLINHRMKLDFNLPEGKILRIHVNGRKWIVAHPDSVMRLCDTILLSFFDKGDGKFLDEYHEKRIKRIRIIILILSTIFILEGATLIMSALAIDINPVEYIKYYLFH